jgi:hypothetical protein
MPASRPSCLRPRARDPIACPDPTRWARCDLLARVGGMRWCQIDETTDGLRAEHWFGLVGETTLAQGLAGERERTLLLFDLAVRAADEPELARWFVQAAFDPSPVVRQLTVAAIATLAVFVAARRAEAQGLLSQVKRRTGPAAALDAGLAAVVAAERGDASFPVAVLRATPEVRTTLLADWGAGRLSGRPLREPEWRRLASHVHVGRRGERLLRRLLRARSTRDVRATLQRICERRGGRGATPRVHALHSERRADPWDPELRDEQYYDDDDRWHDHGDLPDDDGWPTPVASPAQQAALTLLQELGVDRVWPGHLGERLTLDQRVALARRHPAMEGSLDARMLRMLAEPTPLRSLADLELLALARRGDGDLERDLAAAPLIADLRVHMAEAAAPDPRLRCEALRILAGDPGLQRSLIAAIADMHPEQRGLAQLAALCPERPGALAWLDVAIVAQLLHSGLAPLLMTSDPPGGLDPFPASYRSVDACGRDVLRSGAGSLRSQDYPDITLACRPSLSVVRPEHMGELRAIADELARVRDGLATDDPAALLRALDVAAGHSVGVVDAERTALTAHACAYATLRAEVLRDGGPIREAHIRRFARRRGELATPPPTTLAELRARHGEALLLEGLAHAMLSFAREPPAGERAVQRRVWAHRLRLLAPLYELPPTPVPAADDEPEDRARSLVEHLVRAFEHAPLELAQALHIPHRQGLPKLGGVAAPLERRLRHLLRRGLQLADSDEGELTWIRLRPLGKRLALHRGALGRDCSSRYVPLRALSPHHTYYGLFAGDEQLPGYITVFEAFAEAEAGARVPVLVLETINVPRGELDGVHQDLLHVLDAIAAHRGLAGLAVVAGIGTWNYPNERLVTACRRHRQGALVRLMPADPPLWRAFERLSHEGGHYCAFRAQQPFRLLAPFDRARDLVQPENAAEAQRLRAAPPRTLVVTARDRHGEPAAFITAIPDRG